MDWRNIKSNSEIIRDLNIDMKKSYSKEIQSEYKPDFKKLKKRKGGGMTYQLYGGSTKDFSDGNKFIQSFYDKE